MKFDKFFKMIGTHGQVVKTVNNKWLVCGGVGMKVPAGVNTFGETKDPDDMFNTLLTADIEDDLLDLVRAELPKDGKPTDIERIFATDLGDEVRISNANYGLLEKRDRLIYLEIEDDNEVDHKFMLITDFMGKEIVGFIASNER